ncbi:uncharacterized protein LOC129242253 [Anastrepha obliqua]|uniref:uncharacterized protein LOC129242253 n=1 Tax=Anastrepha obliqua TaxID=95512 RepID=UPI00240A4153|nr:uncharacterized protein LOC129242253 [Anastrepha obliqua]
MAPVRNVTTAQPIKQTEIQTSKQQTPMQQQPHKRPYRSTLRYCLATGPGWGGGATVTTSTSGARRQITSNNDYVVSANQHISGGANVKSAKTAVIATGEAGFDTAHSQNISKNNIDNNNSRAASAEVQRKRQHSPEEGLTQLNGSAGASQFNISKNTSSFLQQFTTTPSSTTGSESFVRPVKYEIPAEIKHFAQTQKSLNESPTTTKTASNTFAKLTKANNNSLLPVNLLNLAVSLTTAQIPATPTITTAVATNSSQTVVGGCVNVESILLQRLQLIKHFLSLTEPSVANLNQRLKHQDEEVTPTASASSLAAQRVLPKVLMVYENKPESMERDVVVNSNSLEDVPLSELSDNRAQSIQSLHSVETPTPDTSPSFDELQQRLETSNRNIQNMQEQQQQLLRLQNAAKQHLSEMEHLRQQAGALSFNANQGNTSNNAEDTPQYESIDQVHSDMATLVGRMKNLTTFIQNQNELSNLLGDDGPEILAEQEALQRKLESLRAQRDDMRTLVSELQDINRTAERRVGQGARENEDAIDNVQPTTNEVKHNHGQSPSNAARVVPVTYTRSVPIKLTNGSIAQPSGNTHDDDDSGDPAENAATAMLIKQKVADIETMRMQLQRLKDMMETVNMIEARSSRDVKDIGRTPPREVRSQSRTTGSSGASFDRDCTPVSVVAAHHPSSADDVGDDSYLIRKMRMINDVTSDLRAQAESLQAERDRIKALKEEIVLRKQQAAAAAQLGEDALKRSSLTPTPTPRKQRDLDTPTPPLSTNTENDRDQLKMEYEAKKKEFELLCQRLNQDDVTAQPEPTTNKASRRRDTVSEADDEADGDEELNDSDFLTSNATSTARQYFTAPQQQSTPAQQHRAAAKAAVTAHSQASGAASAKVSVQGRPSQGRRLSVGPLVKEDSFDTNQTSSTAGGRRHSTLANATNTTQEGTSLEAGSVQSGSSQSAFSMPPPMAAMGPCSSWPPLPPMPNTWNPQLYYGFNASVPPQQLTASQPTSATTTHSAGAPFAPVGLLPPSAVNSDCICSAANSATNAPVVTGPTPTSSSTNAAAQLAADPVVMQQFVQTQQMLINSVCQCNQMLWHQQREIDALNNTIHVLQERLLALTGGVNSVPLTDLPYSMRAESVPPPTLTAGTLPNNLYLSSSNRAQSEQPALFLPGLPTATRSSAFSNYQHHQQQQYQQRQQRGHITTAGGATATNSYNFSSEAQQHSNIATANSTNGLYSTLNNAAPPPPSQAQSHYNNEVPQSPPLQGGAAGPGPIFMHHHNNAIHQNNANLRTQNHYANNLHQQHQLQQQQHGHSNINVGGGNTLNNQVPPGNRANNYWDNFRSYSRQNLLSTNSNKSNEEQQNQQNQQQHQPQHYLQQRLLEQLETPAPAHYRAQPQPHHRPSTGLPAAAALTTSNLQQLQRQQQQQEEAAQQQQQRPAQTQAPLYRAVADSNSNSCNNLNFERNASDNKYLRTLQRSHINSYQQQQQQLGLTNSLYSNHNNLYQSWPPHTNGATAGTACANANSDANTGGIEVYDGYNIIDSDLTAPYAHLSSNSNSSNMLRNMNVNFGNSPHYQRNKLLTKPNCRGAEAMEHHNPNRALQQQHQRMLSQHQLALRAQQQLDQSTLRPIRNMAAFTQARYLDLLPATVSEAVATAEAQLRNRESVDMLLRTIIADNDDAVAALSTTAGGNTTTYSSPYMPNANGALLMDGNEIGNNTPNIDNENADLEAEGETELNAHVDMLLDEDDDTTSEEIKRNLLVNALKNDKFTTKFYESIKEDVFRRLERMLLEKESAESNCQQGGAQIRNGLTGAKGTTRTIAIDGPNEILGASSLQRDPTRKFNLNARMGNQQQQRLHQQHQQQNVGPSPVHFDATAAPSANAYQIKQESNGDHVAEDDQYVSASAAFDAQANNRQETAAEDNAEEDEYGANNADTESNKADNEDAAAAVAAATAEELANSPNVPMSGLRPARENEQPEEDFECYNNNSAGNNNFANGDSADVCRARQQKVTANDGKSERNIGNWRQNVLSHVESNKGNKSTSNVGKKRKNQLDNATKGGGGGDAETLPLSAVGNNSADNNMRPAHYTDLIASIITRICNQTHANTQINDTILVEIAKLTASAVQNFTPTLANCKSQTIPSPHISPKKFYMKIKKLSVPRQRDEFLQWYQNYLESLFPGARLEAQRRREELRTGDIAGATTACLELPRACDKVENHQHQVQQRQSQQQKQLQQSTNASGNTNNNDEDLAEADQNSANSSSNTTIAVAEEHQEEQQRDKQICLRREIEFENNENPDADVESNGAKGSTTGQSSIDANGGGSAYVTVPLSAATVAAIEVTEDAINAAVQQHDLLRFTSDVGIGFYST